MADISYHKGTITMGIIPRLATKEEGYRVEPNKVCVAFIEKLGEKERRYTYGELNERANKLANSLLRMGVEKGDKISIFLRNCFEWFDIVFAAAKIGAVYVPVNIFYKPPGVTYTVENSESRWMFVGEDLLETVQPIREELTLVKRFICVGESCPPGFVNYSELLEQGEASEPEVEVDSEDLWILMYTSGTTGFPKGAMWSHKCALLNAFEQAADFAITEKDVHLITPSLCWGAGLHDFTLSTLWRGGTCILMPSGGMEIGNLFSIIEREGVTITLLMPTVLRMILNNPDVRKFSLSTLRLAVSGGESVPPDVLEGFSELFPHVQLLQVYGLTEGGFGYAAAIAPEYARKKIGSTGKPNPLIQMRVVDDEDNELRPGQIGELVMKSLGGMEGFWKMPEANAEIFKGGWLHTGDLARIDEDGFIYIEGRKKDMYISGGLNVYPAEAENALYSHPKVKEVAVVSVPDEKYGNVGKAIIVLKEGEQPPPDEEMISFCKERLATYQVPKYFEYRSEPLPRTVSGKVQKYLLVEGTLK